MTTYSLDDLATRILRDLGIVAPDETPSSEDLEWAKETVEAEIALMAAKGIAVWNGGARAVPMEYLTVLSRRIGAALASSFGLLTLAEAEAVIQATERDLILLTAPRKRPLDLAADDAKPSRRRAFNFTTG